MTDAPPPAAPPRRVVPVQKVREAKGEVRIPVPRSKVAATRAFRRLRADRVAGVLGLALILIAGALLFTWPQPPAPREPTYSEHEVFQQEVTLTRQAPAFEQDLDFSNLNVTRVTVELRWRDDVGQAPIDWDTVRVELIGPASANLTIVIESTTGPQEVFESRNGTLRAPPEIRDVPARTDEEAWQALGDHSDANGTGAWRLRISTVDFRDQWNDNTSRNLGQECPENPPQGSPVCTPDLRNTLHVRVAYRTYRAEVEPGVG
jgi:hypothetical protein